jgi:hypothetical protein
MNWQSYLSSQLQLALWTEGTNDHSQARTHQHSHLDANTRFGSLRNNSRTFTNRLSFLLFCTWCSWVFSILLTSSSLFSYPYSYSPSFSLNSCAKIHCSTSQLLFLILFIHSLPCLHLPLLSFPNLSPHYPSLLRTHHLLTSLLYKLYTTPAPCNP